jgi:hypothetical protein
MKKYLFSIFILFTTLTVNAQKDKMVDVMDDSQQEEEGKLVLRFFNAETGETVDGASVKIEGIGSFTSDLAGKVTFNTVDDGTYYFLFEKNGFIKTKYRFEIIAGTIFFNRFSVSPLIQLGDTRIVLDWGQNPRDLDAHLLKEGAYHISYRNMLKSDDGTVVLDRDDTDGFGPETITINNLDLNGSYSFYVADYTNQSNPSARELCNSKAVVRVYSNSGLIKEYLVPANSSGIMWEVFSIKNGSIQ